MGRKIRLVSAIWLTLGVMTPVGALAQEGPDPLVNPDHVAGFFEELDEGRFDLLFIGDSNTQSVARGQIGAAYRFFRAQEVRPYGTALLSPTAAKVELQGTDRYFGDGVWFPSIHSLRGERYLPNSDTNWFHLAYNPGAYGFTEHQHRMTFSGRWRYIGGRKLSGPDAESNGFELGALFADGPSNDDLVPRSGPSIIAAGDTVRAHMAWATFDPNGPDIAETQDGLPPNDFALTVRRLDPSNEPLNSWLDLPGSGEQMPVSVFANAFAGMPAYHTQDGVVSRSTDAWVVEDATGYQLGIGRNGGPPDGFATHLLYWYDYELTNVDHGFRVHQIAQGGWTMADIRSVVAPTDRDHSEALKTYLSLIAERQGRAQGDERLLVVFQEGVNSTRSLSPTLWRAHLEASIDALEEAWVDAGFEPGRIWFVVQTTHPYSNTAFFWQDFPAQADLVSNERANVACYHPTYEFTGDDFTINGWHGRSPQGGPDPAHCSAAGYDATGGRMLERLWDLYTGVCAADWNADDSLNAQDFYDYINDFFGAGTQADFNRDGLENNQDFFDFVNAFFVGC